MKPFLSFLLLCLGATAAGAQTAWNNQQAPAARPGHIHLEGFIVSVPDTSFKNSSVSSGSIMSTRVRALTSPRTGTPTVYPDTITYTVDLVVNADGTLSGYSITNWPSNALKANLTGSRDNAGNLTIKELPEQTDNNSSTSFCYFNAVLTRKMQNHTVSFEGPYASINTHGTPCEGGYMMLTAGSTAATDPAPSPANTGRQVNEPATKPGK